MDIADFSMYRRIMPNDKGALRQPVLKGIIEDTLPNEFRDK
ncbi:hypothetical protein [Metaclostridioides mangenotii]|nr:hypothetical protein [Clostridioides mangenotii]